MAKSNSYFTMKKFMTDNATQSQNTPPTCSALNRYSNAPETDEMGIVKGYASPVPAALMLAAFAVLGLLGILATLADK